MVAPSGSTATAAVGNDLPISGLFWRQAGSGKRGTMRLSNDSEEQTECCFKIAYPNKGTRSCRIGHATLQQCVSAKTGNESIDHAHRRERRRATCVVGAPISRLREARMVQSKYLIGHPRPLYL